LQYTIRQQGQTRYLEMLPGTLALTSEQDALDWIGLCGELGVNHLLAYEDNLPEAFFDLRSGLAGALLLKFANYRVRLAMLVSPETASRGRFGEMARESNRGNQFGVFSTIKHAEEWLARGS